VSGVKRWRSIADPRSRSTPLRTCGGILRPSATARLSRWTQSTRGRRRSVQVASALSTVGAVRGVPEAVRLVVADRADPEEAAVAQPELHAGRPGQAHRSEAAPHDLPPNDADSVLAQLMAPLYARRTNGKSASLELLRRAESRCHARPAGEGNLDCAARTPGKHLDALDDYLESLHPRRLERLGPERLAELARVFPSLADFAGPEFLESERYRLHRAVRALLEMLATGRALLLALDDLHWADEATVELLLYLLRRPPRAAVLGVLSFRSQQLACSLQAGLKAAEREGTLARALELEPLSASETYELLGGGLGRAARRKIYELSGGNPFYAEQLARLGTGSAAATVALPGGEVPESVLATIAEEVRALPCRRRCCFRAARSSATPSSWSSRPPPAGAMPKRHAA
jgi:hypothetical protein